MSVEVSLPNGMVVSCHQRHEIPLVQLEVQSYFGNGLELNAGDTVFDVGANIGLFALLVHQRCPGTRVYCFEPSSTVFAKLRTNLALHGIEGEALNVGLSRQSGRAHPDP